MWCMVALFGLAGIGISTMTVCMPMCSPRQAIGIIGIIWQAILMAVVGGVVTIIIIGMAGVDIMLICGVVLGTGLTIIIPIGIMATIRMSASQVWVALVR